MLEVRLKLRWMLCLAGLSAAVGFPISTAAQSSGDSERTLVGRLLLPEGEGTRGVEVIVAANSGKNTKLVWMLVDENRFEYPFQGTISEVSITAGINRPIHRIAEAKLTEDDDGKIDLGDIDLRDELEQHSILISSRATTRWNVVRVGMWSGKPPQDVSLGSRQFAESRIGTKLEWLLPHAADSIYFLIEEPADERRGRQWRSGRHHLFGPYDSDSVPTELTIR